jgi:hypothetical protein
MKWLLTPYQQSATIFQYLLSRGRNGREMAESLRLRAKIPI